VEEAQVCTKKSWDVLIPTIRKPGSEIWITFNPELDTDETYKRFVLSDNDEAIVIKCNYSDNPWFPDELEKERVNWLRRDPEGYKTVWEGECRPAVEGAIYALEITRMQAEKRLGKAPYDPLLKVHTVWDLGWNDSMSIGFVQRSGSGEIRIIDYIEDSHRTLDSYVDELKNKALNWGTDFIPHDGRNKDFKSGKSTEEILQAMGRTVIVLGRNDIEEGIRASRMMFSRVWIDEKAQEIVNRLKRYRRTQNQSTGEFGAPLHDESSHGADCFRYIAMAEQQMNNETWGGKLKYPSLGYN
jgi:phage terminase large subunit